MSMKFSRLSAVAGLALATAAGTAQAVNIATDGIGEVVVGSYFTAQPGFQTLINLTNTRDVPIAVKVRIHESMNSRDVLDFTVGLSAFDVWTGVIREVTDGTSTTVVMRTTDQANAAGKYTCMLPQKVPAGGGTGLNAASDLPLSMAAFGGGSNAYTEDQDGGPVDMSRFKEGYIEIISLGYALKEAAGAADGNYTADASDAAAANAVASIIDAGEAIEEHHCNYVEAAFGNGTRTGGLARIVETARQFGEPINALKGNVRILNIGTGTESDVPALTLANFYNGDAATNYADPTADLAGGTPPGVVPGDNAACTITRGSRRDGGASWVRGGAGTSCNNLITKQTPFAFLEPTLNDAFPAQANIYLDAPNAAFQLTPANTNVNGATRGVDAVSALIQRKSIVNEWAANKFADGSVTTEWVVTMPTKLFYVDFGTGPQAAILPRLVDTNTGNVVAHSAANATIVAGNSGAYARPEAILAGTALDAAGNYNGLAYAPFTTKFGRTTSTDAASASACLNITYSLYDRAEQEPAGVNPGTGVVQSPAPPVRQTPTSICYETNVIDFKYGSDAAFVPSDAEAPSGLGHVKLQKDIRVVADSTKVNAAGWMQLDLGTGTQEARAALPLNSNQVSLRGAPVIGFALKNRLYGQATLNYSSTSSHAYLRDARDAGGAAIVSGSNGVFTTGVSGATP